MAITQLKIPTAQLEQYSSAIENNYNSVKTPSVQPFSPNNSRLESRVRVHDIDTLLTHHNNSKKKASVTKNNDSTNEDNKLECN